IKGEDLCKSIKEIINYNHSFFYYGKTDSEKAFNQIQDHRNKNATVVKYKKIEYRHLDIKEPKVFFVNYDMVQTELTMLTKGKPFDPSVLPYAYLFNSYFGNGLSSVVFQEIREAKALAYSAYSYVSSPSKKEDPFMTYAYIGTQSNKLPQAVDAMQNLMNNLPKAESLFEQSRLSGLKLIETERSSKTDVYWRYKSAERRGLNYDVRKEIYENLKKINLEDFEKFFNDNIKDKKYAYCVIGKKSDIDMNALRKLGTVKELSLKEVFGY
ncbi:MAG: M16 family metallopeptidase, partial [Bacteroidota bacterium]